MTRPVQSDPPAAAGRRLSPAERAEIEQQTRVAGLLQPGRGCSALSAGASSAPLVALVPAVRHSTGGGRAPAFYAAV